MILMHSRTTTISTSEIAEPRFGVYELPRNCNSMMSPISWLVQPPSILEMMNVEIAGTNTMVIPVLTPGRLSGMTTFAMT